MYSTYRDSAANAVVTSDAAIAHISYTVPDGLKSRTFTGSGTSKRERGDAPDAITGEVLAMARACEELASRLFREARSRSRAQESERKAKATRRTAAEWAAIQEGKARAVVAEGGALAKGTRISAITPGQAAYEGFVAFQQPTDGFEYETWADKDEHGDNDIMGRADWEAAGAAAITAALSGPFAQPDGRVRVPEAPGLALLDGNVLVIENVRG